jgi:DNA-binding transcriptional regulator GbsR (MarR family)
VTRQKLKKSLKNLLTNKNQNVIIKVQKNKRKVKKVTKMTKIEMFKALKEIAEVKANAELTEKIDNEIALLEKRKDRKSGSLTKTQKENLAIIGTIKDFLATVGTPLTVTEIVKQGGFDLTNQKVSALLKKLVDNGEVVKTVEKKVSYFAYNAPEAEADEAEADA